MNYTILIIIGIAGIIIGSYFSMQKGGRGKKNILSKQAEAKIENKSKILEFLNDNEKITNNDIEELCNVSNATAERYLDQLEKEGKIKQIGTVGQSVYYQVI